MHYVVLINKSILISLELIGSSQIRSIMVAVQYFGQEQVLRQVYQQDFAITDNLV